MRDVKTKVLILIVALLHQPQLHDEIFSFLPSFFMNYDPAAAIFARERGVASIRNPIHCEKWTKLLLLLL